MKIRNYLILWVLLFGAGIAQILFTGCDRNTPTSNKPLYVYVTPGLYFADIFNTYYDTDLGGTVKVFGEISIELRGDNHAVTTTNLTIDYTSIPGVRDTIPYYPLSALSEGFYQHRGDSLCNTDNLNTQVMECSYLRVIGEDYFIMEVDPEVVPLVGADFLTFNRR